nr:WD repeat-containing protein 44-like [Ipomoea batatas]
MMGSCSAIDGYDFFDSHEEEEISSDSDSDCYESNFSTRDANGVLGYEIWTKNPESVDERRSRLLKWMGLGSDWSTTNKDESNDSCSDEIKMDDRTRDNGDTVLANSDSEDNFFSGRFSQSSPSNEASELAQDDAEVENCSWKIRNLDDGSEFVVDEMGQDGTLSRLREVRSNKVVTVEELQTALGSSALVQKLLRRDSKQSDNGVTKKKYKTSWLQKLASVAHLDDKSHKTKGAHLNSKGSIKAGTSIQRVRVHAYKKHSKELSSLYTAQEFHAHKGSILTMKFSPDGEYLASAGKDGIVRVWKVDAAEAPKDLNNQDVDPSCLYFSLSHLSKLASLEIDKEKIGQLKKSKSRKSSESACVILPPKVFRILEQPVHEFHGHVDEVLALSWSRNGYLLSSSVDKTARLWQVGHDQCLGVYPHNNYVTCVEFNPVDDNYFISGSIDGKVRLWEVQRCRVIDWTDVKEIVTAVCYFPDGKGGIVGSMDGNCIFYDLVGTRLQMGSQVSLQTRKRITGFQFCPNDVSKIMVTSADSQVKILHGSNIICKFKGSRNSGSQVPATFTSDGKHVISISEDSNVYIWSYTSQDQTASNKKTEKNVWSSESFFSNEASIAIPWCGFETNSATLPGRALANGDINERRLSSSPDCFSLSRSFFLDSLNKGSATWPEEKLLDRSPVTVSPSISKPDYKILKNAWQSAFSSPNLWGLVVVTAGLDGVIRTFLNYGLPIRF